MRIYTYHYQTPTGRRSVSVEAESPREADRKFWSRNHRPPRPISLSSVNRHIRSDVGTYESAMRRLAALERSQRMAGKALALLSAVAVLLSVASLLKALL